MRIDPNKNTVVCGDNLEWLEYIPDESVDLCYIDPPFFSNRNYEVVWGNGAELRSFGDRFSGGIEKYIDWMKDRVKLIHQKLKQTGYIALHCDYHASHMLRIMLDDIFGYKNFINEIIWHYKRWPIQQKALQKMHDNIFIYAKNTNSLRTFNVIMGERAESTQKRWKDKKITANHINGKRVPSTSSNEKSSGVPIDDVLDVSIIAPVSHERLGYPTQKPEKLISQLIKIFSNRDHIVLDCFCGGGTTAKVCHDLHRKFIVGDVSPVACRVTIDRLYEKCPKINFEVKNLPTTEEEFKSIDGNKFAEMFCDLVGWKVNPKKSCEGGIDGWDANGVPVQIKNHKTPTGRPDIQKFIGTLTQYNFTEGKFVSWEFSKQAIECIMKVKREKGIIIEPVKCADRLGNLLITNEKKLELQALYEQKIGKKDNQEDLEPAS